MAINRCLLATLLAIVLSSCSGETAEEQGHGHSHEETMIYTHYTDATELFVEFPALVVGESSTFLAHVTRLSDHTPLLAGTMDVVLAREGKSVARFRVKQPVRGGIFTPAVKPRDAGEFDLVVVIQEGELLARHELGKVQVFANAEAVEINQLEREGDIGYVKEQQWTSSFATHLVERRALRSSVPGFAVVLAPADAGAEIRAPSDGYFASATLVGVGDNARAGDILGYLVPQLGEGADYGDLTVELERARAQAALAQGDVERLIILYEQGAIAERRLIEARHARDVAESELATTGARIEQYQRGSKKAGIALRAPVSGQVVSSHAGAGVFVSAGERIFQLAAPERRWLQVHVPERYAADLEYAVGAWVESTDGVVTLLEPERGARVVQVSKVIDPRTRTATATIEYPSAMGPTLLGARFPARILQSVADSRIAIPRSAVVDDSGLQVVYAQTGGEMFVRRPVELGLVDGEWVEVVKGIDVGERVVSRGAYYVKLAAAGGEDIGHGHAH